MGQSGEVWVELCVLMSRFQTFLAFTSEAVIYEMAKRARLAGTLRNDGQNRQIHVRPHSPIFLKNQKRELI
jgi:hypothetical protein